MRSLKESKISECLFYSNLFKTIEQNFMIILVIVTSEAKKKKVSINFSSGRWNRESKENLVSMMWNKRRYSVERNRLDGDRRAIDALML